MSGGMWAWAAISAALIIAYISGVRADGMTGGKLIKTAVIWVMIITGCYFLVSWLTGMS